MKISIITPTYNSEDTILTNIESILRQDYNNWEQIIIDNISIDKTLELVKNKKNKKIKIISEKDLGIFDAINKGIENSTGDIISILHSDDYYDNIDILSILANNFRKFDPDIIYGNLIYVKKNDINSPLRFWKSQNFKKGLFYKGWSPPHPTFIIKKKIHEKFGKYKKDLGNSSDFEFMFRMLEIHECKSLYLDKTFVKMRYGGSSNKSFSSIIKQNLTILKILRIYNKPIKLIHFILYKLCNRIMQFINRPKND